MTLPILAGYATTWAIGGVRIFEGKYLLPSQEALAPYVLLIFSVVPVVLPQDFDEHAMN